MAPVNKAPLEGVADRVEIRDGDARKSDFPDESVDVVFSGLALYNILSLAKLPIFSKYWTSISASATVGAMIRVLPAFIPTFGSVFKLHN